MTFANSLDRNQAPWNVEPDLWSILFGTYHIFLLKTGCFALDDLHSEDIEILWILQIVQERLEDTYHFFQTVRLVGGGWGQSEVEWS